MALEMYDASAEEEDGSCTEYWLVVGEEASSLRHVTDYCYASNDIAETSDVIVGPNVITSSSGGDAAWWRNASETSFQLSPFRMLDETWSTEYLQAEAPLLREESWNWDDFEGKVSQQRPTCSEEDEQASSVRSAWLAIPRVTMPAEFAEDLWRTAKLEACSAQLDASDRRGFVVHGQAGASADAALTVLSSLDGSLYVEVRDDAFVTGGRKWLFDDHVELWLAEGGEEVDAMCTELHRTGPVQWGIRIADGKVFPAYGKPTEQLRVQSTGPRPDGTARMRIEVPRKYNRVTIVYSDGDDGQTQERLIATSQLTYGKAWTLGELKSIAPNEAICELVNGGLVARDTHDYSSR